MTMTDISDRDKNLLMPFAKAWCDLVEKIEACDAEELAALTKACDSPTSTNCWWAIKQVSEKIKPLLAAEYGRRTTLELKRADDVFRKLSKDEV
jgi:hypothetical protein